MKLTTYLLAIPAVLLSLLAVVQPGHLMPWFAISCWGACLYAAHEDLAESLGLMLATSSLVPVAVCLSFAFALIDGPASLLAATFGLFMSLGFAHFKQARMLRAMPLAMTAHTTPR